MTRFRYILGALTLPLALQGAPALSQMMETPAQTSEAKTDGQRVYRVAFITYAGTANGNIGNNVKRELEKLGYEEGVNIVYTERAGNRNLAIMPQLAEEIVAWKPDVIVSMMTNAHVAVQKATEKNQIPVVLWSADPQQTGVVKKFRSSGTNFTGFTYEPYVQTLQVRLLKLAIPGIKCIGHLYNPTYAPAPSTMRDLVTAGKLFNVDVKVHETLRLEDFETSIAAMRAEGCDGFVVGPHELFNGNGAKIGELAQKYRLAAVSIQTSITNGGGLAAYSPPFRRGWPAASLMIDEILKKGTKPSDIPLERGFKSPLTLNLKAATALGLTLPDSLIDEADEIIQ